MDPDKPVTCPRCSAPPDPVHGLCTACLAAGMESDLDDLLGSPDPAAGGDDLPPDVPGYTLHRLIGGGGMGQVFSATRDSSGASAAVKLLASRWNADPECTARFAAEAAALGRLDHPAIVRIFETGETAAGRLFIAMELVDGCDLGSLLRAERLPADRALDVFHKVTAALTHAHERGIVHRDVKPSNILIGRDGTVKLADFGLAKHLDDTHSHYGIGRLTQTRDTFGTPYYIAPEVLRGQSAAAPADVYAAGILLYHLLTGSPPLGNYTPLSRAAGWPRGIDAILSAALTDEPGRRTATIAEFAAGVASVIALNSREARRRRSRKRAAAAALSLLALTGAGAAGAWLTDYLRRPPPPIVWPDPASATAASPWTNSLGMTFVPAAGPGLLFSVFETRRREFEQFFSADRAILPGYRAAVVTGGTRPEYVEVPGPAGWEFGSRSWREPGFVQSPDDPACGVSFFDASLFCAWLTWQERTAGRLRPPAHYRLPNDSEWSAAAGLPPERGATPRMRDAALVPAPPPLPGNHAGPEAVTGPWPSIWPTLTSTDPFPRTAPAGSFPPLPGGLHDMGGNVAEWVDERYARSGTGPRAPEFYTIRGASWASGSPDQLRPDARRYGRHRQGFADTGFRVLLDLNPEREANDDTGEEP